MSENDDKYNKWIILITSALVFFIFHIYFMASELYLLAFVFLAFGAYALYAYVLEISSKLTGWSFSNFYKVLIAFLGLLAIFVVVWGWIDVTYIKNVSGIIEALVNGVIRLGDYFLDNIEKFKDFIEWYNELTRGPPCVDPPPIGRL